MKGLYSLTIISSAALAAAVPAPAPAPIVKRALPKCLYNAFSDAKVSPPSSQPPPHLSLFSPFPLVPQARTHSDESSQYDITPAPPINGLDPLSPTQPSGVLGYEKFSTVNINTTNTDFSLADSLTLNPPSPPNVITTGPSRLLSGDPPRFIPADESVNRFNMTTVRYACALGTAGLNPQRCTIKFVGQKADEDSEDVETEVTFKPNKSGDFGSVDLGAEGFTDLVAVEIVLLPGGLLDRATNILFDDVFSYGCLVDPNSNGQ